MATAALRPCGHAGCNTLIASGRYCPAHVEDGNPWAKKHRYYNYASSEWYHTRKRILQRDPICKMCGIRPSTHCDHVKPVSRGGATEDSNLQGLCPLCHEEKTLGEKQ